MALIDEVKEYLRVDADDETVEPLLNAAESYIINAIEIKDKAINETTPLFCLACKMLVTHWYENREPVGQASKMAYGLESIISQLKNSNI